jgi:dsDNA-binding SOS-regulon protein
MKEITAFKTTDGKVFESKTEAKYHQEMLDLTAKLQTLVDDKVMGRGHQECVLEFLIENLDTLRGLLAG